MTDLRKAAQQALEALEWAWGGEPLTGKEMVAIAALRAALAEPEQPYDQTALDLCKVCGWRTLIPGDACLNCERAKQPEQSPVAHSVVEPLRPDEYQCRVSVKWVGQPVSGPLYTAPTPRKPLTYDELEPLCEAFDSYDTTQNELVEFARAIERAHGITGGSNE